MEHLSDYLLESLKTTKSVTGQQIESYNYDIVQVIDRKFPEGISDDDFKKFIKHDFDEVFKLKASQLGKGMDKVVDELIEKEIERKLPEITRWAENKYKRQSARDKYIEDGKEEIRQRVIKSHPVQTIKTISAVLNPVTWHDARMFISVEGRKSWGRCYSWNEEAIEAMLEELDVYFRRWIGNKEIKLRDGVIGWTITYAAYNGTKCPKSETAHFELKLNKETDDIVKRENKAHDDAISAYYDEKGSGGYTGD